MYQVFKISHVEMIDNRSGIETKERFALEDTGMWPDIFETKSEAMDYIKMNASLLKGMKITILPVINVDYDGNIDE